MSGTGQDGITYKVGLPKAKLKGGKVIAVLYYQSIPPFYLKQRFETATGRDGQRLFFMTSRLNTEDTPIDGWRLATGMAEKTIP